MAQADPDSKEPPKGSTCTSCGCALHNTGAGLLCPACLMERLMSAGGADTPMEARPFGDYQLLEELGRGGVGVVYQAWHAKLERTVALKMLLGGPFASPEVTARFDREIRMVARLRHPGIVALYESGEVDGIRFFTMELVEGRNLAALVRDGPIAALRASVYVRKSALAVAHAHDRQILHRDLKPSNILIDATDEPKVADFGLARRQLVNSEVTVNLGAMGSPPYMAPEQVSGSGDAVGAAADIYSLGAILYQLLTGRPPHQGASVEEVLVQVRDGLVVSPRLLNPTIPRDLETICLKCLDKDPSRRYARASDLAADLERFERGEAVLARPVGTLGLLWRWAHRNNRLAAALAALLCVLMAGVADVLWQAAHNRRERERLSLERYVTGVQSASFAAAEGDYPLARTYLQAAAESGYRGFEWRLLWEETASQAMRVLHPHEMPIAELEFSPDGRHLATNSQDGTARITHLETRGAPSDALGAGGGWALSYTPDGKACFVGVQGSQGESDTLRLVEPSTGHTLWTFPGESISLSRDGSRMAVALGKPLPWAPAHGGAEVWDTAARVRMASVSGDYRSVVMSPDGSVLALAPGDSTVRLWSVVQQREVGRLKTDGPQAALAFSPDGTWLASGGLGEAWLWRLSDLSVVAKLPHPWMRVWSLAFSPDSARLATTCSDRTVRIWGCSHGNLLTSLHGHADEVWSVAFSPDGRSLATGAKDGSLFIWPVEPLNAPREYAYKGWSRPLFSPDGSLMVLGEGSNSPKTLLVRAGHAPQAGPEKWAACGFSPDGRSLLLWSALQQPCLRWWSVDDGTFGAAIAGADDMGAHLLMQTGVSPDRRRIFQLNNDAVLLIWDAASGALLQKTPLPRSPLALRSVTMSRDARWFAWSHSDEISFWLADLKTGSVREIKGHRNMVNSVAFSPSGDTMASASSDGTVRLWDTASGASIAVLSGHPESADDVAFSPDGRTLASLGAYQSLKFWHLETHRELATLSMPEAGSFLSFAADGTHLAVTLGDVESGYDRGARVFTATTLP